MLKMRGLVQSIALVMFFYIVQLTQFQIFVPSGTFSQSRSHMMVVIYDVHNAVEPSMQQTIDVMQQQYYTRQAYPKRTCVDPNYIPEA